MLQRINKETLTLNSITIHEKFSELKIMLTQSFPHQTGNIIPHFWKINDCQQKANKTITKFTVILVQQSIKIPMFTQTRRNSI